MIVKVRIEADEWYPCFSLEDKWSTHEYAPERNIEVDKELYERFKRVQQEFEAMQDELGKLHPSWKDR